MGWEKRGSASYFYLKQRQAGKVVSTYYGKGEAAHLMSKLYELRAEKREMDEFDRRDNPQEHVEEAEAADALLDLIHDTAQAALHSTLEKAGYYEHRGQWRKRRTRKGAGDIETG